MARRLELPAAPAAAPFDTYKHCPQLLGAAELLAWHAPPPLAEPRAPAVAALAAEARWRGEAAASLALLCGGALAAAPWGEGIAVRELVAGGVAQYVDCGLRVRSLARVLQPIGEPADQEGSARDSVACSTADGRLVVVSFVWDSASRQVAATVHGPAPLPELGGTDAVAEGADLWITAACRASPGVVRVVVHRVLQSRSVDVVALEFAGTACTVLATARGTAPPRAACWCAPDTVLLAAEASFSLWPSNGPPAGQSEAGRADRARPVLTVLTLPAGGPEVSSWALPRGELLAAGPGEGGLALAVSDGDHDALALCVRVREGAPQVHGCERVPGMAACAGAREQLRLVLLSPGLGLFALVEAQGQSAVTVYGNPRGSLRAPTAAPDVSGLLAARATAMAGEEAMTREIIAASLQDDDIVVLVHCGIVRCHLAADATVSCAQRPLATRDRMPLGIDPESVLRMLDSMGAD